MGQDVLAAVATGDVRESSEMATQERRKLPELLRGAYERSSRDLKPSGETRFSITRGDGWQLYVEEPEESLQFLLHFLTQLLSEEPRVESRASFAIDSVEFLSDGAVTESDGVAFRNSGQVLGKMEDNQWFECTMSANLPATYDLCAKALGEFIDLVLQGLTAKQAQAVAGMIVVENRSEADEAATQEWLAENWDPEPIKPPTLSVHLKRGHWGRISRQMSRFHSLMVEARSEVSKHV